MSLICLLTATSARAQVARGTIIDAAERPVSGVVVSLVDSRQVIVARALTADDGVFRLLAPTPGTYTLRTLRIGFRPVESAPVVLAASAVVGQRIVLAGARVALDTVRVERRSVCGRRDAAESGQLYAAWEQAMTSLAATAMTSSSRGLTSTTMSIDRTIDPDGRGVRTQNITTRTENVRQPWRFQSIDSLRNVGYVRTDKNGFLVFDAPGLDVFASPYFLEDHCLRLAVTSDTTEIGVQFEPAPPRRRLSEISGTMWLSRSTAALRRMEFVFTNVPGAPLAAEKVTGGTMHFAQLPGGAVVIASWEIRMPQLERLTLRSRAVYVAEVVSSGGQVVVLRRGTDTLFKRPVLSVTGVVLDSLSGTPVPRAAISLVGTGTQTLSATDGRFTLTDVLPGQYTLAVRTPSLDSIRASSQSSIAAIDGMAPLRLRVPTATQLAASLCGSTLSGVAGRDKGAVLGTVRLVGDTSAVAGMRVVADWVDIVVRPGATTPQQQAKRMETKTDASGAFRLCGVPLQSVLTLRAMPTVGKALVTTARLSADDRFVSTTLHIDADKAAVATFSGVVVADSSARLLSDADISIPALALSTRSNQRGEFRLAEIPAGEHEVLVRRVGFGAMTTSLTFAANEDEERRIVLKPMNVLDSVEVIATRLDVRMRDFEENRRTGLGHFLTRDALEAQRNLPMASILGMVSGVTMVRGRGPHGWIKGSRGIGSASDTFSPDTFQMMQGMQRACYAKVWVDAVLMNPSMPTEPFDVNFYSPDQIEAVEFYAGPSQTPSKYATLNSNCGVLVIHTRRHDSKK